MQTANENGFDRALCSLEGLSIGDSFGENFFIDPIVVESLIVERAMPDSPWTFTDDTNMALSVVEILRRYNKIKQDELAQSFAQHFDPSRGYGPAMISMLFRMRAGAMWPTESVQLFEGQGSYGNGAAMRVAPIGAYFADDLPKVVEQARLSAEVTHAHFEGIAGAIAIAIGAALAWQLRDANITPTTQEFLDRILPFVPDSVVREKIQHARNLAPGSSVRLAVAALGNGIQVSAQDTVPFALWCASQHLDNFEEAMWLTVSGLGDRDTTCAIVGGIVAMYVGTESIPLDWRKSREPLPLWPFED